MYELRRPQHTAGAHPLALYDEEAQPFFRQAVELGITFWDTSNNDQLGTSEEVVGRAITRYSRREDIVLATKVWGKMHDGSRARVVPQGDPRAGGCSLGRLGTDYIDLYQIHRFDPEVPVEETMEALHDIVKAGTSAISGRRRCGHGSSPSSGTLHTCTAGRRS